MSTSKTTVIRSLAAPLDCSKEMEWLAKHGNKYTGLWVVLEGDRLVSSGPDGNKVYETAVRLGAVRPFLIQIQPPDELPFGGW